MSVFNDFDLTKLPPYGKVFVGLFTFLMLAVFLWASTLGIIESGIFGGGEEESPGAALKEYDYNADMETIMADSEAVTAPNWADSGQEEPIDEENAANFKPEGELVGWQRFESNLEESHVQLVDQTALFFALGLVFLFTTATAKRKKIVYWITGTAVFLYASGLVGEGFCIYANILTIIGVVALLLMVLYMSLRIFGDLRTRGASA